MKKLTVLLSAILLMGTATSALAQSKDLSPAQIAKLGNAAKVMFAGLDANATTITRAQIEKLTAIELVDKELAKTWKVKSWELVVNIETDFLTIPVNGPEIPKNGLEALLSTANKDKTSKIIIDKVRLVNDAGTELSVLPVSLKVIP